MNYSPQTTADVAEMCFRLSRSKDLHEKACLTFHLIAELACCADLDGEIALNRLEAMVAAHYNDAGAKKVAEFLFPCS